MPDAIPTRAAASIIATLKAHIADLEADLASETRWAAQYKRERDEALYVRNEVAGLLDYDEDSEEALLMILKDRLAAFRDECDEWQAEFYDASAALAAICNLLGIDYLQAMEQDQTNPPAAIVEAVRACVAQTAPVVAGSNKEPAP
jgi:hypothetical protein